jgi:hypothetical protein
MRKGALSWVRQLKRHIREIARLEKRMAEVKAKRERLA